MSRVFSRGPGSGGFRGYLNSEISSSDVCVSYRGGLKTHPGQRLEAVIGLTIQCFKFFLMLLNVKRGLLRTRGVSTWHNSQALQQTPTRHGESPLIFLVRCSVVQKQLPKICKRPFSCADGGRLTQHHAQSTSQAQPRNRSPAFAVCGPGGSAVVRRPSHAAQRGTLLSRLWGPSGPTDRGVTLPANCHTARDAMPLSFLRKTLKLYWRPPEQCEYPVTLLSLMHHF